MERSLHLSSTQDSRTSLLREGRNLPARCLAGVAILLFGLVVPLPAAQVRVSNGTLVRIRLHYDLTTENVDKGSRVEFDVADNVVVNSRVVIPKGAVAWGTVVRVKGAGKKRAKDASVTFRFMAVRAIDNHEIPLRVLPTRPKKSDSKENEIEENSPIPGLLERMIGAEKGKEYAAYTDTDALVNAPDTPPAAASSPAAAPAPAAAASPAPSAAPTPAPSPAGLVGVEQASIDFKTTPAGADIVIDGSFVGSTPSTLRVVAGRHTIELRLGGYRTWTRTMLVDPGSHPSIRATLDKE